MKSIHVLRKPCSAPTVAANVLRYGTGALNIDATRIHSGPSEGGSTSGETALGQGSGWNAHNNRTTAIDRTMASGRWPANLVLQHLDGCRQDGVKKVKTGTAHQDNKTAVNRVYGAFNPKSVSGIAGYSDPDGTETVTAWTCAEGCPVASLDGQSGVTKAVPRKPTGKPMYSTEGTSMVWNSNSVIDTTERGFTDTGGASRFFKQVGGRSE